MSGSTESSSGSLRDEDLVARAIRERAEQGTGAFELLVERYEGPLFRFLLVRTGHRAEAEELTQDAFLRAFENLERYRPRWSFRTWLFTLAKRLAVSRARRARQQELPAEPLLDPDQDSDPARRLADREELDNLWDVAARVLSPEKRSALWLCHGEGLDAGEIAAVLGRPRVTVRVLLFRARQELARALGVGEPSPRSSSARRASARPATIAPTPSGSLQ